MIVSLTAVCHDCEEKLEMTNLRNVEGETIMKVRVNTHVCKETEDDDESS